MKAFDEAADFGKSTLKQFVHKRRSFGMDISIIFESLSLSPTVSNNHHAVLDLSASPSRRSSTLALPEFLSQLRVQGHLAEEGGQSATERASLVDQCSDLYNRARHKDGVRQ